MLNPETSQIWVLTVDDDRQALDPVRRYFASTYDIHIISEARNGQEVLERLESITFDVVLVDGHMPEMNGLSLLKEIQLRQDPPVFIAITTHENQEMTVEILSGTGAGRIIKSAQPQEVITAVREAILGFDLPMDQLVDYLPHLSEDVPEFIPDPVPTSRSSPLDSLNEAERLILHHLCEGLSNADIAKATDYSEATVKKYVSQMISRFGVTSRLSLAVTVIRSGMREPED
ncbi:response regulator [Corynebacterium sp. A21]|uniref:response regulator n=1 Tax=Corynebacterium sp. A21 TaxID=3457318 RepID=UPI003FD03515